MPVPSRKEVKVVPEGRPPVSSSHVLLLSQPHAKPPATEEYCCTQEAQFVDLEHASVVYPVAATAAQFAAKLFAVGVPVGVAGGVGVKEGVFEGVSVAVLEGVPVSVGVSVTVLEGVGESVGVSVALAVGAARAPTSWLKLKAVEPAGSRQGSFTKADWQAAQQGGEGGGG